MSRGNEVQSLNVTVMEASDACRTCTRQLLQRTIVTTTLSPSAHINPFTADPIKALQFAILV